MAEIPNTVLNSIKEYIQILNKNGVMIRIRKYKFEINPDIEPLPFTQANFTKDDPFVREILETGFRIV